jgi:hypothetical protein
MLFRSSEICEAGSLALLATAQRIAIAGSPASGKSWFARQLARLRQLPLHQLDDIYWEAQWRRPSTDSWLRRLDALIDTERWIIDGNYQPTLELRLERAQLLVFMDVHPAICLARYFVRTARIACGNDQLLPRRVRGTTSQSTPPGDLRKLSLKIVGFRHFARAQIFVLAERQQIPILQVTGSRFARRILAALDRGTADDIRRSL